MYLAGTSRLSLPRSKWSIAVRSCYSVLTAYRLGLNRYVPPFVYGELAVIFHREVEPYRQVFYKGWCLVIACW